MFCIWALLQHRISFVMVKSDETQPLTFIRQQHFKLYHSKTDIVESMKFIGWVLLYVPFIQVSGKPIMLIKSRIRICLKHITHWWVCLVETDSLPSMRFNYIVLFTSRFHFLLVPGGTFKKRYIDKWKELQKHLHSILFQS